MLVCLVISALAVAAWWWRYGWIVSPDTRAYLEIAAGSGGPSPFRWRAIVRALAVIPEQHRIQGWKWFSWMALVASGILVGAYAEQRGVHGWAAAAIWVTLPWFRGLVRNPCLTDQIGMAAALGCAVLPWWATVPCALVAGASSERAPVFAAVFAWSPLPLVGIIVPAAMALATTHRELSWTKGHNDWRAMRELHSLAQPHTYLLPFGALLLAPLAFTWQAAAALALGVAQWLVATDRSRLLQWGAPVLVVVTLLAVPERLWTMLVVYQIAAPWCDFVSPWK